MRAVLVRNAVLTSIRPWLLVRGFDAGSRRRFRPVVPAALEAYDFNGIELLVDVAGGHGEVVMPILDATPTCAA